jgi:probable DNA repair protein
MNDPLLAAAARGATLVTPNKRLAREIVSAHDRAMHAAGATAWPAARVLPWPAFVGELWQQALDAGLALPPLRLDAGQAAHLWQRIVADSLGGAPLLDAVAAAALAAEAWERSHAYGEGGDSWRGFAAGGPEVESFVRWAQAFARETRRQGALDLARAPDAIAAVATQLPGVSRLDVAWVGFVEESPQQRRLLAALACAGARVVRVDGDEPPRVARGRLYAATSPRDELANALAWARAVATDDPQAQVGIVVHDLPQRRAQVAAMADDLLCPGLQWPGRERAPRPYDISTGGALGDVPLVAAALSLIALAHGPIDAARAATLVRSRYLPGDPAQRAARAALERGWREQGQRRFTLGALAHAVGHADAALSSRWRAPPRGIVPARGSPREFTDAWRRWLELAGWCDGIALDAAELAARGAWSELLAAFVRLTAVAPRMTRDEALAALGDAAQAQIFEPQAPLARIRILGVLEAAGLSFDAVWIAGLSAAAWPRAPEPNPLLPIEWQRLRELPRATAARELAYARALTARLDASAPQVVFSYATTVDGHGNPPSPLIAHLPPLAAAWPAPAPAAHAAFAARAALEQVADERAPPWPAAAPLRGGATLIEAQSACPFQAMARFRLRAEGWPDAYAGLAPTERGKLVHAAFAAFWRDVRDQRTLLALDAQALDERIARAVATGRGALDDALWHALPPVVAAVETGHVERLMRQWLDGVDRVRPPFAVAQTELGVQLTLAGHALALRIDRLDDLGEGRTAVIDYKTGLAVAPERWFDERPQGPQLGLYAMALGEAANVAALAYAQLKPGRVKAIGIADAAATWPGLPAPEALRRTTVAGWRDAQQQLAVSIGSLAQAAHDGDARVLPREPGVCRACALKSLCRTAAVDDGEDGGGDGDGDDGKGHGNGTGVAKAGP